MRLWELLEGTGYEGPAPQDVEIEGISYDTRTIVPGQLFVALRGYKTDGHRYIEEARAKGAAAVVAEEGEDVLLVPDSRAALAALSTKWFGHPAKELAVVGVTGTNGKTTTTTLLWQMLQEVLGSPVGLLGTNVNRVGEEAFPAERTTPESYDLQRWLRRMADAGCSHVVMEVSSHALCMRRTDGIRFAVGAFTNLSQDHLDFHKTMEEYRRAKGMLFAQSDAAVLNLDDEAGRYYQETAQCGKFSYSESRDQADLTAKNLQLYPDHIAFEAVAKDEIVHVKLNIPGAFSLYNALCALACAKVLGLPLERAAAALAHAPGVKGRMEVVPHSGPGTVIIDYAHTPDALEKVLTTLRDHTPGRLICLFGCGGDRDRSKRAIMGSVAADLSDVCIVTSDNPRSESCEAIIGDVLQGMVKFDKAKIIEPDRPRAIRLGLSLLKEGDTLLLAGKGHETYQEVNGEKRPMDEREIVAKGAQL